MQHLTRVAPWLFLLMWSSGAIFVKLGLEYASVWSFLTLRCVGAFAVTLLLIVLVRPGLLNEIQSLTGAQKRNLFVVALLLQIGYQSLFFLSIAHQLSPGLVAIVLGLQPILTPMFAKERLTLAQYSWLGLGFGGLTLAIFASRDTSQLAVNGLIFALLAVVTMVCASIQQKQSQVNVLISSLLQNAVAGVCFATLQVYLGWEIAWTPQFILALSWMTVVVSVGAILLMYFMLSQNQASKVNVLFYLVPLVTLGLDNLVYQAPVPAFTLVGVAIVLFATRAFVKSLSLVSASQKSEQTESI